MIWINSIEVRCLMQGIVDWLRLPVPAEAEWEKVLEQQANRGNPHHSRVQGCEGERAAMLSKTRQLLEQFYAPWNVMLAAQLGPTFAW